MGKSDEKQTKKRAHKATDGESKHKKQPSFDTHGSSPVETTFEAIDNNEGLNHSKWRYSFRKLCEYKVQFGHCFVPRKYAANPKLGRWVSRQRTRYKKNTEEDSTSLTAEHIRALDGISFDWGTSKTELASMLSVRFEQLREFKVEFGHCLVPRRYAANPKLGGWVDTQRQCYRLQQEGKPSPMTAEHIRALDGIGFDWGRSKTELASMWSVRFEQLRECKVQFGRCLVPRRYNPKLAQWAAMQRHNYRMYHEGKRGRMTAERIRKLESVEFKWE